jgi:hypothetical protein
MPYASAVIAIDPGPEQTAVAVMDRDSLHVWDFFIKDNLEVLDYLNLEGSNPRRLQHDIRIEMIASYGMAVGATVFETCVWIGRFMQAADPHQDRTKRIFRREVKMHLCGNATAKDANIRQAIIDKYESMYGSAVTKKGGMLYRASKDVWAAIGVGITAIEKERA